MRTVKRIGSILLGLTLLNILLQLIFIIITPPTQLMDILNTYGISFILSYVVPAFVGVFALAIGWLSENHTSIESLTLKQIFWD